MGRKRTSKAKDTAKARAASTPSAREPGAMGALAPAGSRLAEVLADVEAKRQATGHERERKAVTLYLNRAKFDEFRDAVDPGTPSQLIDAFIRDYLAGLHRLSE